MNANTDISSEKIKQRLKRSTNPSGDYVGELLRILAGSDTKLTGVERSELINCVIKYVVSLLCVLFTAAAIYFASVDPKAVTNRYFIYSALIIIPIVVGSLLITPIIKSGTNIMTSSLTIMALLAVIFIIYYLIKYIVSVNTVISNYILMAFIGFTIITTLAIGYRVFYKVLKNVTGWKGFVIKLLFYLPCLLLDFVHYFIQDVNNTPKTVLVIFVLQVLIIALYFTVDFAIKSFGEMSRIKLLGNPLFLKREYRIGDNDTIRSHQFVKDYSFKRLDQISPNGDTGDEYLKNYSLSMWVYINPMSETIKRDIPIFKYGNNVEGNKRGKPYLVYNGEHTATPYIVYYSDNDFTGKAQYAFDMPIQKWNYIVITYKNSTANFYLNGVLLNSHIFEKVKGVVGGNTLPMYSKHDTITVGYGNPNNKTVGINGAICNVSYHRIPLKDTEISAQYALMSENNPPV